MDVVTVGETMVLFTPISKGQLRNAHTFSKTYAGAESNVAIGLSRLDHQVGWISRVGHDEFGKSVLSFIRGEGVDTSQVQLDSEAATGVFFKEVRNPKDVRVTYYRNGSAASRMSANDLDEEYLKKAKYLHLSGITPALSASCYEMVKEAIRIAKKHSVTIIFDPNVRRSLWSEEQARRTLLEIAENVDIILPGIDEGAFLLGEKEPEKIAKRFLELGPSLVVLKVGAKGAYYFTETESKLVPGYLVEHVVDPVGAGDGFLAGFTSGLLDGLQIEEAVQRGNAVGAMVTMVEGDVEGLPDKQEIEAFIKPNIEDVQR
ncbi:sugar kinase [Halalkalibacter okhensis]|uniref:2-dehydro-3-deoxygluconokinase n=1 Tax=Halalkalibacter okhensis TaxID=333138 RepID=A0A0B0IFB4_9BACI|nr:sugar kinase [Halalkalibacter okhensis]KHF39577.1 2-dehydro-3-deoxygluconokinase [Halalkalibacter okhensis]